MLPTADEASARTVKARAWEAHVSCHPLYEPQFSRKEYLSNRDSKKLWQWKCRICGKLFEAPWNSTIDYAAGTAFRKLLAGRLLWRGSCLREQEL